VNDFYVCCWIYCRGLGLYSTLPPHQSSAVISINSEGLPKNKCDYNDMVSTLKNWQRCVERESVEKEVSSRVNVYCLSAINDERD